MKPSEGSWHGEDDSRPAIPHRYGGALLSECTEERLKSRIIGKFDSQLTNRTMYSLSVNDNLCRWRCLVSDACSEWQQFLAFRGSLPAKRAALQAFHRISSDPTRLWEPLHLVRPFETLGTTTSSHTLRDSRNRNISSDPTRIWEPQRLVRPCETLGTATSRRTIRDSGNHYISSDPSRL
jgi:hypothetical protein